MKKTVLLSLSVMVLAAAALLTGCKKQTAGKAQTGSLKLEAGTLTWKEQKDAVSYDVDLGSGSETVSKATYPIAERCTYSGDMEVTVYGVDAKGSKSKIGSMEITAQSLKKPLINIGGTADQPCFTWKEVEGASGYTYDANDGNGAQIAKPDENGLYSVPITNMQEQRITVTAHGNSKGSQLWTSKSAVRTYTSSDMFDMKLLGTYPAVFTGKTETGRTFILKVGSTLKKGLYDLEVSMYMMNADGYRMTGNGSWGRRIKDKANIHHWFCENAVSGYEEESIDTVPDPTKPHTVTMKLSVDRGGNVEIPFIDFVTGEKVVICDIRYNGASVLNASNGVPNPIPEIAKMNVENLDRFVVAYQSPGKFDVKTLAPHLIKVPADLPDGKHTVKVTYYICDANGDIVEGNGGWARRLSSDIHVKNGPYVWLNEYQIDRYPGVEIPHPTVAQTSQFTVEVKNGKFNLVAIDFLSGEYVLIEKVHTLKELPSGNGIFISEGKANEKFEIQTTLSGKPRKGNANLSISYRVKTVFGDSITGNGAWGRRIVTEKNDHYWMCANAASDAYPESANTLPSADQVITKDFFFYEINRFGKITLDLFDFSAGDMIEVISIKYNGEEVLVK